MTLSGSLSAFSRRGIVVLGLAALLCATSGVKAQTPPAAQAPAAAPAAAPDPFKFTSPSMGIIWIVKPDKTADFEAAWAELKAKAAAVTDNPDLKAQMEGLKIYKVQVPAGSPVTYIFLGDPTSKLSYSPTTLIYEYKFYPTRPDADKAFERLSTSIQENGISPLTLSKLP